MYAVEFDLRDHPGPHIVVGFMSREEADEWAVRDTAGGDASWSVILVEWTGESREHAEDLAHKLQHLVDWTSKQFVLEDGCFTFPDGDTWQASPEEEKA